MSPSCVNITPPFYCIRFCPQTFVQRFNIINKKLSLVQNVEDTGLKRYCI